MANSRELVEVVSTALELRLTEVTGHMRHLREAGQITKGGRGITAPRMTYEDAATLVCSLYGAEFMKDGVASVLALKALPAVSRVSHPRGDRGMAPPRHGPHLLGSDPAGGVVAGLACALRLLGQGNDFLRYSVRTNPEAEVNVRLSIQFPKHFASLTVGFDRVSEIWTFGQHGRPRTRQTRECDEIGLREIAKCLEAP